MIPYLGDFVEDDVVYVMFNTFTSDDPSASCTITNLVNTDIHIHKDDGLAQRNNAAGITVSVNFDGITGSHMVKIDTNNNTVAGFWVTGHDYFVRIEGTTVDGATINAVVAHFSIQNRFMRGTDSANTTVPDAAGVAPTAAEIQTQIEGAGSKILTIEGYTDKIDDATNGLAAIKAEVEGLAGAAMRGTDNAALAATALSDVTWTDAKAAFLNHSISTIDGNVDTILSRVTAAVALASVCSDARLGELDAANLPTDVANVKAETATIVADTNELQTDWHNGGRLDLIQDIIAHDTTTDIPGTITTMQGNVTDIVADTNELQTDWHNGGRLDLLIDACALEATVAALNDISVADIIAGIADGSYDLQEMMRIIFSSCALKSNGGGTATLNFRNSGDSKNRLIATVDGDGNRTAVTLDGS